MSRPRWGIVGTGGISRTVVGDLHLTENVDLLAVASRTAEAAERFAVEHEVPRWHGSYEALFADEDVDVVYIGTPIGTHTDVARAALRAGTHVLLETAFTTTADEARELAALAGDHLAAGPRRGSAARHGRLPADLRPAVPRPAGVGRGHPTLPGCAPSPTRSTAC